MSEINIQEQIALIKRGADKIYSEKELGAKLKKSISTNTPLRIKLGLDPTAPDIHLGHTVVLRKLRQFQNLGHQAVLIIGDATAKIGDPTGKSTTRPILNDNEIKANLNTYLEQVKDILNLAQVEIVFNSNFFKDMKFEELMQLAGKVTVSRLMERDDFQNRFRSGTPISLHEFFYPLMQGWDSVQVKADVELGGTDQTFNNLMGRDLQRSVGQEPQVVLVMPILEGLDGSQKMSKSLGNYIGVSDQPGEMFGKVMSIPDKLMQNYFVLLTAKSETEIKTILAGNPRDAKAELARTIVTIYYSAEKAADADTEFTRIFREKKMPNEIPTLIVPQKELEQGQIWICKLIVLAGHTNSTSEARRLVQGGAVTLAESKIKDPKATVAIKDDQILKSGKRRFARLKLF